MKRADDISELAFWEARNRAIEPMARLKVVLLRLFIL